MKLHVRNKCIHCNSILGRQYFVNDLLIPIGLYNITEDDDDITIPYNVFICRDCFTIQNKYLGNLDLVYKYGHNEGTGKIYNAMHLEFKNLIIKNINVRNVLEVGCSVATLSDLIIKDMPNILYTIVEPNCKSTSTSQRVIHKNFIENIHSSIINKNDTLILSHVLEHFYEPKKILDKLLLNTGINYFYLAWPDLDHYIENCVVNIVTIEHTYYVSCSFLENLISTYGFVKKEKIKFRDHTIFYFFERDNNINTNDQDIKLITESKNLDLFNRYIGSIKKKINSINQIITNNAEKNVYIWPCSTHNLTMLIYDEVQLERLKGFIDNSPNKIGKKTILYNKPCVSFSEIDRKQSHIILNGGPFNNELILYCTENDIDYSLL